MQSESYDIPLSVLKQNTILTKENFYTSDKADFKVEISLIHKIDIIKIRFIAELHNHQSISAKIKGEVSFNSNDKSVKHRDIDLDESAPSDSLYLKLNNLQRIKDTLLHITFGIELLATKRNDYYYSPAIPGRDNPKKNNHIPDNNVKMPITRPKSDLNDSDKVQDSNKVKDTNKIKDTDNINYDTNHKDKIKPKDDKDKKIDDPSPFNGGTSNKKYISTPSADLDSDSDDYEPTTHRNSDINPKYNGLYNQGATCYINSAIQSLFHIPIFRKIIFDIPTADEKDHQHSIPLNLQCLFYNLQNGNSTCSTKMLTTSFGWEKNEVFHQQDIEEFFKMLLTKLDDIMKKMPEMKNKIGYVFEGKTIQLIKDTSSKLLSENQDIFLNLSVDVGRTLEESLEKLTKKEYITDYVTESSTKPQHVTFETLFFNLPKVLFIHIKRYKFNPATETAEKIDNEMKYAENLDLKNFMYEKSPKQCTKYKLFGVIVHSGMASAGHYYIYCKPGLSEEWYEFNDTIVRSVNKKEAIDKNFGGYENYYYWKKDYSAFMLIYVQTDSIDEVFKSVDTNTIPTNIIDYAKEMNNKELKRTKSDPACKISFNVYNEKCVWDNCNKGIASFINNKYCINITVDKRSTAEDLYNEVSKQTKVNSNCIRIFQISQDEKTFGKVIKPTDKLSLIHNQNIFAQFKDEKENLEINSNTRIFFIILYTPNSPKPFIFILMRKYKMSTNSTYGIQYPKYEVIIDDIAQLLSTNLQTKISNKDISIYLINNHKLLEKSYFLECIEDNGTIMIIQINNPSINIDTTVRSTLKSKLKITKYFKNIESNDDSEQSEIFRYMDYMENKLPKAVDKYFELRNNTRKSKVYDYTDINRCKGVIEFPKSVDKENLVSFIALAFGLNINDKTDTMLLFSREENLNVPKSKPFNLKSSYSNKLSTTENINNIYYLIAPKKIAENYRSETRIIQISKNAYSISKTICYYLPDEDCHPFSVFKLFTEDSFITGDETRMFIVDENNHAGAIIKDDTSDDLIKLDNKNKLRIEKIPNDQKSKQLALVYQGYLDYLKIQIFGEPLYFGYDDNESVKSFKSRISKFLNITKPFKLYNDTYFTGFPIYHSERNVLKDKDKVTLDSYSKNKVLVLLFDNNDA